jgi:hypothetical protein
MPHHRLEPRPLCGRNNMGTMADVDFGKVCIGLMFDGYRTTSG